MANAGLVKELEARGGGKPLSVGELDKIKSDMAREAAGAKTKSELPAEPGKAGEKSKG
jgi:NADH-quinone oxidoreductase subunit E